MIIEAGCVAVGIAIGYVAGRRIANKAVINEIDSIITEITEKKEEKSDGSED